MPGAGNTQASKKGRAHSLQGKQIRKKIIIEQPRNTVIMVRFKDHGNLDVIRFAELGEGVRMYFPKLS